MATALAFRPRRSVARPGLESADLPAGCDARRARRRQALARGDRLPSALQHELVLAAQSGDPEARGDLVESLRPLIAGVARLYQGSQAVDQAELMQEGVVGLLRALERYDPSFGTPFWAYATWWVRQAMQQIVSELTRPVVLSDRALRQLATLKSAHRERLQAQRREPSLAELAGDTGLSKEQIGHLMVAERFPRALEEPIGADQDAGATLGDQLADPRSEDEYERVPQRLAGEELRSRLRELSGRELTILRARYRVEGTKMTLHELGTNLGVSAERVRQIEQGALVKLRTAVAA